jgi:methylmalonyl-CoA/ethylmalonyl-CoA epimerase
MGDNSSQFKLKEVTQIGFVVRDAHKVAEAWTAMFGIGPWTFRDIEGTEQIGKYKGTYHKEILAQAYLAGLNIELVQPVEGTAVHRDFLNNVGEGIQHIQVRTENVEAEADKLAAQGAVYVLKPHDGVAYMSDLPGGMVLEIVKPRPSQVKPEN